MTGAVLIGRRVRFEGRMLGERNVPGVCPRMLLVEGPDLTPMPISGGAGGRRIQISRPPSDTDNAAAACAGRRIGHRQALP